MNIDKVVNPGCTEYGQVFCRIRFNGTKLSITGVEGPMRNGNCMGGAGQIIDTLDQIEDFAPGWDADLARRFRETWERWHLNDMRAACEHQRAEGWGLDTIEIITYGLTKEASHERYAIKENVIERLKAGHTVKLSDLEQEILNLPYERHDAPDANSAASGRYGVMRRETKTTGWVYPTEHPLGVLTKPCPVCGHKYGAAWLCEEVPTDVIEFLADLPDTTITPAWV